MQQNDQQQQNSTVSRQSSDLVSTLLQQVQIPKRPIVTSPQDTQERSPGGHPDPATSLNFLDEFIPTDDVAMQQTPAPQTQAFTTSNEVITSNISEPTPEELIRKINLDIERSHERRVVIERDMSSLLHERKLIEQEYVPIKEELELLLGQIVVIEKKEHENGTTAERRVHEQERWKLIEKEYALRKKALAVQYKTQEIIRKIKDLEEEYQKIGKDEALLAKRVETIEVGIKAEGYRAQMRELISERAPIEEAFQQLTAERIRMEKLNEEISGKEKTIEGESDRILTEERSVSDAQALTQLIEKRYALEKERHEIEVSRWKLEDELSLLRDKISSHEAILARSKEEQETLEQKIAQLSVDTLSGKG